LFFDRIDLIVPRGVNASHHARNIEIFDAIPESIGRQSQDVYEVNLSEQGWASFYNTLDFIAEKPKPPSIKDGQIWLTLMHYSSTHVSKLLGHNILPELRDRGLIHDEILSTEQRDQGFHGVDARASNLVLSLIADTLASSHGLRSITNNELGFALNSMNHLSAGHGQNAIGCLASAIIATEVPRTLTRMSAEDYVELRKRFAALRLPVQRALRLLSEDNALHRIADHDALESRVTEIAADYHNGVKAVRASKRAKNIKEWCTISIGAIFRAIGMYPSVVAKGLGNMGLVSIQSFQKTAARDDFDEPVAHSQRLVSALRKQLQTPRLMRRLTMYPD